MHQVKVKVKNTKQSMMNLIIEHFKINHWLIRILENRAFSSFIGSRNRFPGVDRPSLSTRVSFERKERGHEGRSGWFECVEKVINWLNVRVSSFFYAIFDPLNIQSRRHASSVIWLIAMPTRYALEFFPSSKEFFPCWTTFVRGKIFRRKGRRKNVNRESFERK